MPFTVNRVGIKRIHTAAINRPVVFNSIGLVRLILLFGNINRVCNGALVRFTLLKRVLNGQCRDSTLFLQPVEKEARDSLMYEYDFGGGWMHEIRLEAIFLMSGRWRF